MRQTEKEFALVFWLLGLLIGTMVGYSIHYHYPTAKECVCDRSECL